MPRSGRPVRSGTVLRGPERLLPAQRRSLLAEATLSATLTLCRWIGTVAAAVDLVHRPRSTGRAVRALRERGFRPLPVLREVWFGRTAREILGFANRLGGGGTVGGRIDVTGNVSVIRRPCILAALHSDWWRILAPHIPASLDLALVAGARWRSRFRAAAAIPPSGSIRELLDHLDRGGSVALTVDHFSSATPENCRCEILGEPVSVPLSAAKLAARNDLPLVPVTIRHHQGRFLVTLGQEITASGRTEEAMRETFSILAGSAADDPASWGCLLRFLRASHGG